MKSRYPVNYPYICSIGYDIDDNILEVEFKEGSIYHYFDVPEEIYWKFREIDDEYELGTVPVKSSRINEIGYDDDMQIALVELVSGEVFLYLGIDEETYVAFANASSPGSFLNRTLKYAGYRHRKIGRVAKEDSLNPFLENHSGTSTKSASAETSTAKEPSPEITVAIPGIKKHPIDYLHVTSVGYDQEDETMEVEFLDGSVYQYYHVPKEYYERFATTNSDGSDIFRERVESHEIRSIGYDSVLQILHVGLHDKSVCLYFGITEAIYKKFMAADSHWAYLNQSVKWAGFRYHPINHENKIAGRGNDNINVLAESEFTGVANNDGYGFDGHVLPDTQDLHDAVVDVVQRKINCTRPPRKNFAKVPTIVPPTNPVDYHRHAFELFLQQNVPPESRKNIGLEAVFRRVFPVNNTNESLSLEYKSYVIGTPRYDLEECYRNGFSFTARITVKFHLVMWAAGSDAYYRQVNDILEQQIYFGEMPIITDRGTFVINGSDHVVSSQLHHKIQQNGCRNIGDINHLGNRRVYGICELLEGQCLKNIMPIVMAAKKTLDQSDSDKLMPHDLFNSEAARESITNLFFPSPVFQLMNQTNPLSEHMHKSRIITPLHQPLETSLEENIPEEQDDAFSEAANDSVSARPALRDIIPGAYGRLCPVETPVDTRIGLVSSLAMYARINDAGQIEAPYISNPVGLPKGAVHYYTANEEENEIIASSTREWLNGSQSDRYGTMQMRKNGKLVQARNSDITLHDVAPTQMLSVAAALTPFLEHNVATRATFGIADQLCSLPLLFPQSPLVATGMETHIAKESGTIPCRQDGVVQSVDAKQIIVRTDAPHETGISLDTYNLSKFCKSNQNTCKSWKPSVAVGERVRRGDAIVDCAAVKQGELALGQNVLTAFMCFDGGSFGECMVVSERLLKEERFTSCHFHEFECAVRDTMFGKEWITSEIPDKDKEYQYNLDEFGLIKIGTKVKAGDILVGKRTPISIGQLTPEDKLLQAIFGVMASGDIRDTSLIVPPDIEGIVSDVKVYARKSIANYDQDSHVDTVNEKKIENLRIELQEMKKQLQEAQDSYYNLLVTGNYLAIKTDRYEHLETLSDEAVQRIEDAMERIREAVTQEVRKVKRVIEDRIKKLERGDDLPPGVVKLIKVSIATKRPLQVGDQLADRHGNKGVVSRILPEEEMPFMVDGTPIDVVINPLITQAHMTLGQLYEAKMGLASWGIGRQIGQMIDLQTSKQELRNFISNIYDDRKTNDYADSLDHAGLMTLAHYLRDGLPVTSPAFDGATNQDIEKLLSMADLPASGQVQLVDGKSGDTFKEPITAGVLYLVKQNLMVEDIFHARFIGPYSLVTEQPLGGDKSQFGGQEIGEEETWALEAYGAAYTLQECMTVKSDDVEGRVRTVEALVDGKQMPKPGLPESFNVLIKELQALAMEIELLEDE